MNISENEWSILSKLWEQSPLTLKQLCDTAGREHGWTKHGVISTLKRMEAKGSIRVEQTAERKYFYPAISEVQAKRQETELLADKAYGGSKLLLISNIVTQEDLNEAEIDELMAILKKRKG